MGGRGRRMRGPVARTHPERDDRRQRVGNRRLRRRTRAARGRAAHARSNCDPTAPLRLRATRTSHLGSSRPAPRCPRLGGLRADRREVLRERRRRSRLALSSLLDTYHFCIVGRDQKLRIDASSSSQVARCSSALPKPGACAVRESTGDVAGQCGACTSGD